MGFFTPDTKEECLKLIEKINHEMRAINASVHLNYNMIDGRNREKIRKHFRQIINYSSQYEKIKNRLPGYERIYLETTEVDIWNGEHTGVMTWEIYLHNILDLLYKEINY